MDPSSASAGQSPFAAVGILRAAAVALALVRDPLSPASSPTATPMDPVTPTRPLLRLSVWRFGRVNATNATQTLSNATQTPPTSWVRTIALQPGGAWDPIYCIREEDVDPCTIVCGA